MMTKVLVLAEDKVYSSVLDYMCKNHSYSLYATDFDALAVSSLQRAIASVPTTAGNSRVVATKYALQDFFNALCQQVFVYDDEDRLKIVKYFDYGAVNEEQDRLIHALRVELVKYKDELSAVINKDLVYMFKDRYRTRFEFILMAFKKDLIKNVLRKQISLVFDMDERDVVIFLNKKIFIKKFKYIEDEKDILSDSMSFLEDKRFVASLWVEISKKLYDSFSFSFEFINFDEKYFFKNYPIKFFSTIKNVVKQVSHNLNEKEISAYSNIAFKKYLPLMLREASSFILEKVLEGDLKAIKFLKLYSQSTKYVDKKMKLNSQPLMSSSGQIYMYQNILTILKKKELLNSKITHKKIELKKINERVTKSLHVQARSENEMVKIEKRRLELLLVIEKVEREISKLKEKINFVRVDADRLEFSKRDLLEAFKQVEVRLKTQNNIQKNTNKELEKWELKRNEKTMSKEQLEKDFRDTYKKHEEICELLAISLGKEAVKL